MFLVASSLQARVALMRPLPFGRPSPQRSLASMYATGRGVPLDYVEAHKWYNLAAANIGDILTSYVADRDELAKKMTSAQLAEAQQRASEWHAAFDARQE